MEDTEKLVESIVNGIREKKGSGITVIDLRGVEDTVCRYFVICQANSASQILAIADSVRETARKETGQKPLMVEGTRFAHWVAMDYTDVMVHLFVPELRRYYNLEHLWADAVITCLPDE